MQCEVCTSESEENPCKKCTVLLLSDRGRLLLINKAKDELRNLIPKSVLKIQMKKYEDFLRKMKGKHEKR